MRHLDRLRKLVLGSVMGSAVVLSIATSAPENPTLYATLEEQPAQLSPTAAPSVDRPLRIVIDEEAYELDAESSTGLAITALVRSPAGIMSAAECFGTEDVEPLPRLIEVEVLDAETSEKLSAMTLPAFDGPVEGAGACGVGLAADVLADGVSDRTVVVRISLTEAAQDLEEVSVGWRPGVVASFPSLAFEDQEQVDALSLKMETIETDEGEPLPQ